MSKSSEISLLKRAHLALEKMQARVEALEKERTEPIALIGIGCRFPGKAMTPNVFWHNLREGHDAIAEVPSDRWDIEHYYDPNPEAPGKMSTRWGGFIEDVDQFDGELFGITPREARSIDPQQRILMEVAWEALEDAGHGSLTDLENSSTGVFVGVTTDDYAQLLLDAGGLAGLDTYFASGVARSIASGRLSYQFGLKGPAISIDTACSSSLVAVHLACRSLLDAECHMALAAGVNLILSPVNTVTLSKYQMMAPDGKCKAFDSAANGFVRGEGCGVVVLKRLKDAIVDNDHIYALILGSAINQDGPSSGLTAPNGPSQLAVMRAALERAKIEPSKVSYIEAHGTGTALGDPIEARAIGECYCADRPSDRALIMGSVKPNIGHLEATSGIAGLIKTVLVLQHMEVPPNLNFNNPNPNIPWDIYPLHVPTAPMKLQSEGERAYAAVSGLGFSGTNVHMVLSNHLEESIATGLADPPCHLVTLSAKTEEALKQQAATISRFLASTSDVSLSNTAYTLDVGRTHHSHRLAIVTGNMDDLQSELMKLQEGKKAELRTEVISDTEAVGKKAFLFTGQGAQYCGMGHVLYQTHPLFRKIMDKCDQLLNKEIGGSILEVIYSSGDKDESRIHQTQYTQPALFVIEYALSQLWLSWGVRPAFVMGHSIGEYVAACVAGIIRLEDALRMVAVRSRIMQSITVPGAMVAVMASEDEVEKYARTYANHVSIAAVNGPRQTVISGYAESVRQMADRLESEGIAVVNLNVSHAFHSHLLDPFLEEFKTEISDIRFGKPKIRLVSNVTGSTMSDDEMANPEYWCRHARSTVRFLDGMQTLAANGCKMFIEIGPKPVLTDLARKCVDSQTAKWIPSLNDRSNDWERMLTSLADVYLSGVPINWAGFSEPLDLQRISLPGYAFQRQRYWFNKLSSSTELLFSKTDFQPDKSHHSLLGRKVDSALGGLRFFANIGKGPTSFFAEHRVADTPSLPMAAVLEAGYSAAKQVLNGENAVRIENFSMDRAVLLPDKSDVALEWVLERKTEQRYDFRLFSSPKDAGAHSEWLQHASGVLTSLIDSDPMSRSLRGIESYDTIRQRCPRKIDSIEFYKRFDQIGLNFGPAFQTLKTLWIGESEALGILKDHERKCEAGNGFSFSPLLLDGALQVIGAAISQDIGKGGDKLFLPIGLDYFEMIPNTRKGTLWAYAKLSKTPDSQSRSMAGDVYLLNEEGEQLAIFSGCRFLSVEADSLKLKNERPVEDMLYNIRWEIRDDEEIQKDESSPFEDNEISLHEIKEQISAKIPSIGRSNLLGTYETGLKGVDQLVVSHILKALHEMGWRPIPGNKISFEEMATRLNVATRHRRVFKRFFDILTEEGILSICDDGWQILKAFDGDDALKIEHEPNDVKKVVAVETNLVNSCGEHLAEVLKGDVDPLDILFSAENRVSVQKLYRESVTANIYNTIVKKCLQEVLKEWPKERSIKVLEIGGGTGGTTKFVLDALERYDFNYYFTDVSPAFAIAAREQYKNIATFQAGVLDIERDPVQQGFSMHHYDIIIAANVLHATSDLKATLSHVNQLTGPGGCLVLLEVTGPQRWVDLTFGLTEGWWKFTDYELRPEYPLISIERWGEALQQTGFGEFVAVPERSGVKGEESILDLEAVIIARSLSKKDNAINTADDGRRPEKWLILSDSEGIHCKLQEKLEAKDIQPILISRNQAYTVDQHTYPPLAFHRRKDFDTLINQVFLKPTEPDQGSYDNPSKILWLWGLDDSPAITEEYADPIAIQRRLLLPLLFWVNGLVERNLLNPPQLVVATQTAQSIYEYESIEPSGAALWGMGRAIMQEYPELQCKFVDIDGETEPEKAIQLIAEIQSMDRETQTALRGNKRYVPRLEEVSSSYGARVEEENNQIEMLDTSERGLIENLFWRGTAREPLSAEQVRIAVQATGLNFRDVLNALGVYADGPVPFGGECAGIVTDVGEKVGRLRPGDPVLAIASNSFRSEVTADSRLVWHLPEGMSAECGASLPIAYITAAYALKTLADLKAGQSILIHAAAGGVGLAAVHLAKSIGAEIFATAGSSRKRNFLRQLGLKHVMNSRNLDFADYIASKTKGNGVSVVLNSLTGDFVEHSIKALSQKGVFLELGRSDIWTSDDIAHCRPDVTYHPIFLTEEMTRQPEGVRPIMSDVLKMVGDNRLPALPVKLFPKAEVQAAFRYMSRAKHIGKIVVRWPDRYDLKRNAPIVRSNGTYWITGGLGALGLFTAEWLAKNGAGHVILTSRKDPSPEADKQIDAIRQVGTRVTVMTADIALRDEVDRILMTINNDPFPLRGIIHAAGVLDDGVLKHQNWHRFEMVL